MSRAFSTGHHPLGTDLRMAVVADADDVAHLLSDLGYPCEIDEAAERIAVIADNDRQALVVARRDGAVVGQRRAAHRGACVLSRLRLQGQLGALRQAAGRLTRPRTAAPPDRPRVAGSPS